ncbi:MAG: tetratricopeptide repeat protein [Owenweeksia sp.]
MAKKNNQEEDVIVDVGQSLSRMEKYLEENRKSITFIVGGLFVIVVGYFAYLKLYQEPRETEAQEEIYMAQTYFEQDSLQLALNGDGQHLGFIDIASEYSGTKAGNLANYYAGISYLNSGKFEDAITYLDDFDSDDPIFSVIATGSIGDAFLELDQPEEALDYYDQAVSGKSNSLVVPFYLKKAGILAEEQGDLKKANGYFTRIQKDFADSPQAADIEKFIARVEAKMNS